MTELRAPASRAACAALFAVALTCAAEEPPAAVYLTEALPPGFTREPSCTDHTICVSKPLFMLDADFLAIRDLALAEIPKEGWEITAIKDVMSGMVLVTAQTKDRGFSWGAGERFLVERQNQKWVVIRKQHWVV